VGTVNLGDNISITADQATNALIINADKSDYEKVLALLKDLDIRRKQVLVEAMLLEVGVDEQQAMSTSFLISAGGADGGVIAKSDFGNDLTALFANPTSLSQFSAAAASAGTLTLPGGTKIPTQTVLLNAAKANTNVNVLSAPTILASDNEQAEIVVGQNVPFLASTSSDSDNLNNTFNQIDRQDVGITLRLTPQISGEDAVRLNIFTEVSSVVASTAASELGPTTTIRTSETSVITKDGQMVVTGGLMSDDISDTDTGVPFLKDIPFLGHVFRDASESRRRTNLLIFITPKILRDQFDARDSTLVRRNRLEEDMEIDNHWPRREEILHNSDLDNVAETGQITEEKLGTIRPAKKLKTEEMDQSASNIPLQDDAVLELEVAPKLPDFSTSEENGPRIEKPKEARGALRMQEPNANSERFLVLTLQGSPDPESELPFRVSGKKQFVALHITAESAQMSGDFFKSGESYLYQVNGSAPLKLNAQGIFPSAQEAAEFFSDEKLEFYTLSPYEVFNLGSGPWKKASELKAENR